MSITSSPTAQATACPEYVYPCTKCPPFFTNVSFISSDTVTAARGRVAAPDSLGGHHHVRLDVIVLHPKPFARAAPAR